MHRMNIYRITPITMDIMNILWDSVRSSISSSFFRNFFGLFTFLYYSHSTVHSIPRILSHCPPLYILPHTCAICRLGTSSLYIYIVLYQVRNRLCTYIFNSFSTFLPLSASINSSVNSLMDLFCYPILYIGIITLWKNYYYYL